MDFFPTVKAFIDFFEADQLQNESEILADRLAVVSLTELGWYMVCNDDYSWL